MLAFEAEWFADERPEADARPGLVSEWSLSVEHSLQIGLCVGDRLYIDHGTVWLGTADRREPVVLSEGDAYTAVSESAVLLMGSDNPRVTVHSGRPVRVSVRADYGEWRYRSLTGE